MLILTCTASTNIPNFQSPMCGTLVRKYSSKFWRVSRGLVEVESSDPPIESANTHFILNLKFATTSQQSKITRSFDATHCSNCFLISRKWRWTCAESFEVSCSVPSHMRQMRSWSYGTCEKKGSEHSEVSMRSKVRGFDGMVYSENVWVETWQKYRQSP